MSIMDTKSKVMEISRESDEWKRTLAFLSQENAFLKLRLASILNSSEISADTLETAELYQSRFIQKDETIKLMLHDVSNLDNLLLREIFEDGMIIKEIAHKQGHLRTQ